jgi:hypothetical protein
MHPVFGVLENVDCLAALVEQQRFAGKRLFSNWAGGVFRNLVVY